MATALTHGYTFGITELVTNSKLHALVDNATISLSAEDISNLVFYENQLVGYGNVQVNY